VGILHRLNIQLTDGSEDVTHRQRSSPQKHFNVYSSINNNNNNTNDLCFINKVPRNEYKKSGITAPLLLTSALDGNERSVSRPGLPPPRAGHATPLHQQKLALNFADRWRSLSRYSWHAD
jgi:hypothetical protein